MKKLVLILFGTITALSLALAALLFVKLEARQTHFATLKTAAELDAAISRRDVKPLLVDLRDRKDYEEAHIADFLNIPFGEDGATLSKWIAVQKRDKPIVLICYKGNRSARAFELLVLMGFRNISDYSAGYEAYASAKGPEFLPASGSCNCPE